MKFFNRVWICRVATLFTVALFFGGWSARTEAQTVSAQLENSMTEISFATQDGVTIFGSWILPMADGKTQKRPVVILLHDYGVTRRDWGMFIPALVQQGYNVLAFDLRGHGQSQKAGGGTMPSVPELMQTGVLDVQGALKWLKTQKHADTKRVALIGVGVGGDLAYLAAGAMAKKLRATVVISPSYATVLDGTFEGAKARAVLFCVSAEYQQGTEMLAAETLANFTRDPKKVILYQSAAHGLALFYKHPEITRDILGWIALLRS